MWLYTTPPSHVEDVTVVTELAGKTGTVRYQVEVAGPNALAVQVALKGTDGTEVARGAGSSGELVVEDVHPWRPGEGHLYELTVELRDSAGVVVDSYSLPVGIRSVEVSGARFWSTASPSTSRASASTRTAR